VISLKTIGSEELKRLVILLILDALSSFSLSQNDSPVLGGFRSLRHLLVLDEARKILLEHKYQSLVDLIRQGRSKGSVVMLLSQDPSDFDGQADDFTTQLGTVIAFACAQSTRGLRSLQGVFGRRLQPNEFVDTYLPPGVAFTKLPNREPERIRCWAPANSSK
jgi:DNA helicase HerA-like ATPase